MDQRTEPIRQDIDAIRDSMTDKMEQIESKIKGTVEDTRQMVDIKYQVSQRPWTAMGVSLLIGYALGSIGGGDDTSAQPQRGERFYYYNQPSDDRSRATREHETNMRDMSTAQRQNARRESKPGFLDQIMDEFGDEIELLKGAALMSVTGLIRDTVHRNLPALQQEVDRIRSERSGSTPGTSRSYATTGPTRSNDSSKYYDTADQPLRERSVGEVSTQVDVGRNPNYEFIPPGPRAEPGGRP
jgi:hypothetical protein